MQDLDDEFMDDISSDAGSASGNDDDDTASGHIFECGCEWLHYPNKHIKKFHLKA